MSFSLPTPPPRDATPRARQFSRASACSPRATIPWRKGGMLAVWKAEYACTIYWLIHHSQLISYTLKPVRDLCLVDRGDVQTEIFYPCVLQNPPETRRETSGRWRGNSWRCAGETRVCCFLFCSQIKSASLYYKTERVCKVRVLSRVQGFVRGSPCFRRALQIRDLDIT